LFFSLPPPAALYTHPLSLHDALPIFISPQHARVPLDPPPVPVRPLEFPSLESSLAWCERERAGLAAATRLAAESGLHETAWKLRSEEHTSELQSRVDLVCRLLLEKKK